MYRENVAYGPRSLGDGNPDASVLMFVSARERSRCVFGERKPEIDEYSELHLLRLDDVDPDHNGLRKRRRLKIDRNRSSLSPVWFYPSGFLTQSVAELRLPRRAPALRDLRSRAS